MASNKYFDLNKYVKDGRRLIHFSETISLGDLNYLVL